MAHLWNRYHITKKNYLHDQLQIINYINIFAPCSYQWQEEITKKLIEFIIQYIQPLYILQVDAFWNLLLICKPGYRIPCNKTVKEILYSAYEWTSKKEGEKLECLCLNLEEKEFFQQIIGLLKPIEYITHKIYGTIYPTINLINPYMDLLKNFFAPCEEAEEMFDTYLDLIYGSELVNNNRIETNSDNINTIEDLPLVNTTGILQKVHAAIFLLLDELWSVLSNISLITTFLDPCFKNFE
ncbi:6834_t:CDS:2 [Gigaspora margarita]|uniref:6834_t:CDS:1 n=1 Tax=Gigaspora margarita TaxID=4874 RepID=A0ABN7UFN3_GIGMA|nr:6834_t:CDS:2 [Gigaspora margarita]